MNIYQQQILDHYHHPRNSGKPESYTNSAKLQNLSCGDEIEVYLDIKDGKVTAVHYEASGCAISIASASILSEELIGKSVAELTVLDAEFITDLLGIELTTSRLKCAHMALQAIQQAAMNSN